MYSVCRKAARAGATAGMVLLLSMGMPGHPMAEAPAQAELSSRRTESGAEFILAWPQPVEVEAQSDSRELLLRFSQPLGDVPAATLVADLPDLLEDVRYGFDSLLIRSTREVTFEVVRGDRGVVVRMTPVSPVPPIAEDDAANEAFRLDLLRALALLQDGEANEARRLLAELHEKRPQDVDAIANLALAETQLGRWRRALELYDEGLALRPNDPGLADARAQLLRQNGTYARLQPTYIDYHNSDREVFTTASGKVVLPEGWAALGVFDSVYLNADNVRRVNGRSEDFEGARVRAELGAAYDWDDGASSTARLLVNPDSFGGALSHSFGPLPARTSLKIAYHQAEWRYLEGVVNQGTRDYVGAEHQHVFSRTVQGGINASLNRYNVRDEDDVARSVAAGGFLRYALLTDQPLLTISYYLDSEYADRDKLSQPDGNKYSPLPIQSRAVNSIELAASSRVLDDLNCVGGVGYSVDAVDAEHGPLVVAGIEYFILKNVGISLNFRHALASASGQDGQYSEAGLSLVWHDL
jgi:hypothetical protein